MRTLAIDHGLKRIGLALSDESGKYVSPHDVLHVRDPADAVGPIVALVRKEGVRRLLVGLPLNMDGTVGPQAKAVVAWAKTLQDATGLTPVYVDERLSSFDAEQTLIEQKRSGRKLTRQQKKDRLDALAAAGFLQAFLDGQLAPIDTSDIRD
ncbi:MAG: Holliday junction resolvase RuvX [Tepidisphaeraceae bacterium]